ncbi:uncharacterized protein [Palaemon carinicauda]|uniref:uncharacterized protein isoform X3 n=1 Tax=Palaemon carinicauda TaxID=392227 RepID=UPI0035B641CF
MTDAVLEKKMYRIRTGVISGRLATQMVLATIVVVFLGTYALLKVDIGPQGPSHDTDVVVVPVDELMKNPVSLQQDDPRLIERIRSKFMFPPSKEPYNLVGKTDDPSMGQSKKIREILGDQENGFFIECGALDGETRSNTLVFEKRLGWSGVLIEGDPKNFELVTKKNRKAWTVNGCLSTFSYPNTVMFKQQFNVGKISSIEKGQQQAGYAEVQCLPVYSILLALNRTTIDYFSLDVEGAELPILRTIPWDKVNIKTLSVEFVHGGEGKEAISKYMNSQGYDVYAEVTHPGWLANDYIFVQKDLLNKIREKKGQV